MIAIQLISARIGRVTGKGLAANVMELAPRWLVLVLVALLVAANTFNIAADIAAMAEALSLVIGGLNHEHALIFASASTLLQIFVPYRRYAPVLKFMTLVLFAYVVTALTVRIPWGEALLAAIYKARYDAVDIVFENARLTEAPVAVALHRYVEGIIEATRQWPVAFDQMIADPTTAARRRRLGERLDAFIGRAVDEGLFRGDLPEGWIEALLRQVIRVAAEDVPDIQAAQAADLAVDALLHGVGRA